ncbi:hypothetical protein [Pseudomonas zeae]|jgi:hypothetical protein|uniref:Uncharacterized protein n=1 Tax=Pseudomonas zeae TaxID=2745510 RepID=A0A9E6T986_9PSED|nr:hypothetical protein [Pseudomonas zeae]QXI09577.1 hypothetical protein HU754_017180 [Pseudomonas zeae]
MKLKVIMKKICKCEDVGPPIECQKLMIHKDTLDKHIEKFTTAQTTIGSWQLPLSLFITLLVAVTTTNFQEQISFTGISRPIPVPPQADTALWLLVIGTLLWTIKAVFNSLITPNPREALKVALYSEILNKPDRTSLFIIKGIFNGDIHLLVENKATWDCFFLPYVKHEIASQYRNNQKDDLIIKIKDKLGLKSDEKLRINLLQKLEWPSEKYDPPQKVVKEYHFDFFHVTLGRQLPMGDFTSGNRNYSWKTLNQLEEDPLTMEHNSDILQILRVNQKKFLADISVHYKNAEI